MQKVLNHSIKDTIIYPSQNIDLTQPPSLINERKLEILFAHILILVKKKGSPEKNFLVVTNKVFRKKKGDTAFCSDLNILCGNSSPKTHVFCTLKNQMFFSNNFQTFCVNFLWQIRSKSQTKSTYKTEIFYYDAGWLKGIGCHTHKI